MIKRQLQPELIKLINEYPVVTILGPRQAGKTTLAQTSLPHYAYCNLELPEQRQFAEHDPKGFLNQFKEPVVLDEIQRVPSLLSYIQVLVDQTKTNGQFVLTGSHQLQLQNAIVQSLAGRTAILQLLPLSIKELETASIRFDQFEDYVHHGFLPRVYDQKQRPFQAYSNYYQTYVERDVKQLIQLNNLSTFEKFIKLLAGRVGQLFDYSALANDVGVDAKTIKNWLSILEASFIIFKLSPYFENFGKRVIKSPKYYFTDVGLLAFLLGLEEPHQIRRDPLVGNIFENLVIIECLKSKLNQGKLPNLYFFRDQKGNEVDLLFQKESSLAAVEIKSSATFSMHLLVNLKKIKTTITKVKNTYLIYNGEDKALSTGECVLNFHTTSQIFE